MTDYFKIPALESMWGAEEEREKDCGEELEDAVCVHCEALSWQTRIIGCFICLGIGFLVSMGSTGQLITRF